MSHGRFFITDVAPHTALLTWLKRQLWVQKLNNPLGLALLLLATLPVSYLVASFDLKISALLFYIAIALP